MPDLKIKGYSSEFTFRDVPKIYVTAPESTEEAVVLVPFTYGNAVSKTVEPDFSGGDMAVPISDSELVKQLTISKPADLKPENIPDGMYIAGVGPGTFAGGGGGGSSLIDFSNTAATEIGEYAYWHMTALRSVHFTKVTTVGAAAFQGCTELTRAEFDVATALSAAVFSLCSKLDTLILRSEAEIATIAMITLSKTPIADGTGYVYVPAALLESYAANNLWSTYAAQLRAIEDYPEICG